MIRTYLFLFRFLATGSSYTDLALRFRMGRSTVAFIIQKTIKAIISKVMAEAIPKQTYESWKEISRQFKNRWNFPNCLGTLLTIFEFKLNFITNILRSNRWQALQHICSKKIWKYVFFVQENVFNCFDGCC